MTPRSLVPMGLLALSLSGVAGCKKEAPPSAAEPESSASAAGSNSARPPGRLATGPFPRIDPQAMKNYRLDMCYYGTLTLRQARESYLASLGKDEPSEKKIPNFGVTTASLTGPQAPTMSPARPGPPGLSTPPSKAAPPPAAKPLGPLPITPVKPGSPASIVRALGAGKADAGTAPTPAPIVTAPQVPDRRPFDFAIRAPHERNARTCTAALTLREPAMGDVDTLLATYAPFAVDLAKDITAANSYYIREEYKKDGFAKGKELHKKLLEEFGKLDEQQDKLGAAIAAFRKEHAPDPSKLDEGEKMVDATFDEAREVLLGVLPKKIEGEPAKIEKFEKSLEALKDWSGKNTSDTWSKIMIPPFDAFLKVSKDAKISYNGIDNESFLTMINNFTNIVEAHQRAVSRALIAHNQAQLPPPGQGPQGLPPGHPVPTPPPEPAP